MINYKKKKKKERNLADFTMAADFRVKMKESENMDKYLNFAKIKKLWNMKIMGIPVVVDVWKNIGGIGNQRRN